MDLRMSSKRAIYDPMNNKGASHPPLINHSHNEREREREDKSTVDQSETLGSCPKTLESTGPWSQKQGCDASVEWINWFHSLRRWQRWWQSGDAERREDWRFNPLVKERELSQVKSMDLAIVSDGTHNISVDLHESIPGWSTCVKRKKHKLNCIPTIQEKEKNLNLPSSEQLIPLIEEMRRNKKFSSS